MELPDGVEIMTCDLCSRPAVAMVGEGNEILVCEVHLERYKP